MALPKLRISRPDWAFGHAYAANEMENKPLAGIYPVEHDGEKRLAVFTSDEYREDLLNLLRRLLGSDAVKYDQEYNYWHIPESNTPEKLQQLNFDFVFTDAVAVKQTTWLSGITIVLQYWFIYLFLGLITSSVSNVMIPSLTIFLSDPFLCSGEMQVESTEFQYMPGQTGVSRDYYCIDEDGTKHYLSFFSIASVNLTIHFLIILFLAYILNLFVKFRPLRDFFSKLSN